MLRRSVNGNGHGDWRTILSPMTCSTQPGPSDEGARSNTYTAHALDTDRRPAPWRFADEGAVHDAGGRGVRIGFGFVVELVVALGLRRREVVTRIQ